MTRSEINQHIEQAIVFMDKMNFKLPPWGYWTANEFKKNKIDAYEEIVNNALGWDLTDFGSGNFKSMGLLLFTIRNGSLTESTKSYAEKIMIVDENQVTPLHRHKVKTEDIINRGGGNLIIELYPSTEHYNIGTNIFALSVDGIRKVFNPGDKLILTPGESVCLTTSTFHKFYGEPGKGTVLVGEVSTVNDDDTDNVFYEKSPRFPLIDEDEPIRYLLAKDYKKYL